jgi:hypothetical protein
MASSIKCGAGPDGVATYLVDLPPERLPPVRHAELARAWDAAHHAAAAAHWGAPRKIMFRRDDGEVTVLAIADEDARCWADAVDRLAGLDTAHGLALCLRLLALIDLLGRAPDLSGLFDLEGGAAELHPSLLRAAAAQALDSAARFDEAALRRTLAPRAAALRDANPASA